MLREAPGFPAALSAIRGHLATAPVPPVLEEALAANVLNALAKGEDGELEEATLSPESGKWQPRGKTTPKSNSGSFAPMHGTVQGGRERFTPHNDGKIQFGGNNIARDKADGQARRLGYVGIDELMQRSTTVPKERIDEILVGGNEPCEAHEAVAALRTCANIPSGIPGEQPVKLGERPIRHYVCGERRHRGGEPDVGRLETLPLAIRAIRHPESSRHEFLQRPIVKIPGKPLPRGAQTVYIRGNGKTFVYADSGVLTGWANH